MQIDSIEISNFRAVRHLRMEGLSNLVVVAGTNGCGKSSIFNAIRLLKSAYGEYHHNEWQSWFAEFQIDINQLARDAKSVLSDPQKPLKIGASFSLAEKEKEFLRQHGRALIESRNWQRIVGRQFDPALGAQGIVSPQDRVRFSEQVTQQTDSMAKSLLMHLDSNTFDVQLLMSNGGQIEITPSPVMELILSSYMPDKLGIIDYHGSQRVYGRQNLSSVNLQLKTDAQSTGQHALYNTQNKYANIKTQMASEFVNQLIAKEAGASSPLCQHE